MNKFLKSSPLFVRCLLGLLIIVALLWGAEQLFLRPVLGIIASKQMGTKVTLGGFSLNIFSHQIKITDLRIFNEEGFPSKIFFEAPEILVDIDILDAIKGKLHFPLIVFHVDKFIIFKDSQGKLNINELKIVQEKSHEKNKGALPNFKIDELRLNIGEVVVEDDSKAPSFIEAYDLNLKDKTIRNINGVPKLVGQIMFEALKPTAIQGAGMYAATTLLGVGFLPGLAIGVAIAKDDVIEDLPYSSSRVYQQSMDLVKQLGQIKRADDSAKQIFAKVYNCDITIQVHDEGWGKSGIIIKARKYFLAKPEIAAGMLYQLKEELR